MKKYIVVIKTNRRQKDEIDSVLIFKAQNEENLIKEVVSVIGYDEEFVIPGFSYTTLKSFLKCGFLSHEKYIQFNWEILDEKYNRRKLCV